MTDPLPEETPGGGPADTGEGEATVETTAPAEPPPPPAAPAPVVGDGID